MTSRCIDPHVIHVRLVRSQSVTTTDLPQERQQLIHILVMSSGDKILAEQYPSLT